MNKRRFTLLVSLVLALALFGCTSLPPLPDGFAEAEVAVKAEEVLAVINTRDYEAVTALFRSDVAASIDAATIRAACEPLFEKLGSFQSVKNALYTGTTDANQTPPAQYATVILRCKYDNGTAQFTISFDPDFSLVGLYMK